jgi:hypothetical protein
MLMLRLLLTLTALFRVPPAPTPQPLQLAPRITKPAAPEKPLRLDADCRRAQFC